VTGARKGCGRGESDIMSREIAPIKYVYNPNAAELRFMTKHIYFISKIAIREYSARYGDVLPGFSEMAPPIFWAGILLGLVAAYLCGLLVSKLHSAISDREAELAAFKQGPIRVTLDKDGIHTVAPNTAQFLNWRSVRKVVKTPQGIGLRLDESHYIPIIENELPDDVSREDVLAAINIWRGSEA